MRKHAVAAVLFLSVGICCAFITGLDLAVLSQDPRQELGEMAPASVLRDGITVVPILKTVLFAPSSPAAMTVFVGALFCGAAVPFMAVAAVLVYRGRPLGSLLAALVGACLIGFSLFGAIVIFLNAVEAGAYWYVRPIVTLFGLAALSYVLGLWAIPPHAGSGVADAFARRALTTSALGIAALAAGTYTWYLVAEHLLDIYVSEPPLIVVTLAALVAAGLAVLAKVTGRRGGSKGVLVVGGAIAFPALVSAIVLVSTYTGRLMPAFVIAAFFVVPLLAGMVRLAAEPAAARADGRAPAVLVAASIWAGPVITLLSVVGIDQARRIAHEEAGLRGEEIAGDVATGDWFLETAASGVRAYAVLFAVAVVGLTVLARRVRSRAGTPGTQAALVTWGMVYLVLLAFAASYTPFVMGDSDEPVHPVVIEGPGWYLPAVRTILVCSAAALVAASVLLVRRLGRTRGRTTS
ncbi:hypothetical protein [Nonomuraea africana]|uniref:hypothetical protein n=1 Tax=Nonomuraea africana TaxID=46171 RepID=UPI0033CAF726